MGSINVLLGRSRWRRRRVLPAAALSGIDPWGRPTFLFVATSAAKRRAVEREFVAYRPESEPCFAPSVRVLNELLDDLWARHGDGRAPLSATAGQALARRVLDASGAALPWLGSLGNTSAVARSLFELRERVLHAGGADLPAVPHRAELNAALSALGQRIDALPMHLSRGAMLRALVGVLERPSPALMQQLRQFRTVIFDDLLQPSPVERAVLVALCRALATSGCHVVVALESGRDLGGEEAGVFFDYDDVHRAAYALRPFQATRRLRTTLFSELIASGEASLAVAGREGLVEIEPAARFATAEAPDLSDYLFGPRPLPVDSADQARDLLGSKIRLRRYADATGERRAVVRQVKAALQAGARPDQCVVAVPGLAGQSQAWAAALADVGVSAVLGSLPFLSTSPVSVLALAVATIASAGFPVQSTFDLCRSDLVAAPQDLRDALAPLESWCVAAGVGGGLPLSWKPTLDRWFAHQAREDRPDALDAWLDQAQGLVAPLSELDESAPPVAWFERLVAQLTRLGVPELASGAALTGWGSLLECVHQLGADLQIEGAEPITPASLRESLADALSTSATRADPRTGDQVEVLDIADLVGLTPDRLWVCGLTRSAFPGVDPGSFLVPAAAQRELEVPRRAEQGRYLFASLLRNALDDPHIRSLHLSWPQLVGGSPTVPSPLLQDLLNLPTRMVDDRGEVLLLGQILGVDAPPTDPVYGRDAALAHAAAEPAWRPLLDAAAQTQAAHQTHVAVARSGLAPGEFDGLISPPPPNLPTSMGVTRLESYLRCPARFWYGEALGLAPLDAATEDVAADRRGTVLHDILEAFLEPRLGRPITADGAADLHAVATERLDALAAQGGFAPALLESLREEWTAGLIDDAPRGVLAEWLHQEVDASGHRTPVEVESGRRLQLGPLTLRARLDRVDETHSGVLVIDYKSGKAPDNKRIEQGLAIQPVVYGAMAANNNDEVAVASAYVTLRRADEVSPKGWVGHPDVLGDVRASKRSRLELTPEARRAYLDYAADAARRLHDGVFHPTLADPELAGCSYCEFSQICRIDSDRAEQWASSDADLQRPRDPGGAA